MFFIILHLCLIHLGTYKSPFEVNRINAELCKGCSIPVKSTAVISYPCLPALIFVPACALEFLFPKVPDTSINPFELLICEQKKLLIGLFGPLRFVNIKLSLLNNIWSPVRTASPSCAETNNFPLGVGSSGDLNPDKLIFASLIENENYELN